MQYIMSKYNNFFSEFITVGERTIMDYKPLYMNQSADSSNSTGHSTRSLSPFQKIYMTVDLVN